MGKWDEKTTDMVSPTALNGFLCPTPWADFADRRHLGRCEGVRGHSQPPLSYLGPDPPLVGAAGGFGVPGGGHAWVAGAGGGGGARKEPSARRRPPRRWVGRRAGWTASMCPLSPKKSVFIGEGCWRRGGGGPQSGRPFLRPRDPAAAQIAEVRRNNFAEGGRAPSGASKRHHVIGAVHGLTLCTQGHRFARGPREQIPRSERI